MAKYRLYWYPGTCARVPFVALEEMGIRSTWSLKIACRRLRVSKGESKSSVPALVIGDKILPRTSRPVVPCSAASGGRPSAKPESELEAAVLETLSWFSSNLHPLCANCGSLGGTVTIRRLMLT